MEQTNFPPASAGKAKRIKGSIYRVNFDLSGSAKFPLQIDGMLNYDEPIDRNALACVIRDGGGKKLSALLQIDAAKEQSGCLATTYYYIQNGRYRGGRRYTRCGIQLVSRVLRPKIITRGVSYLDIDIVNSRPSFAYQVVSKYGYTRSIETPFLREYAENRNLRMDFICKAAQYCAGNDGRSENITTSHAKSMFLRLLNGGSICGRLSDYNIQSVGGQLHAEAEKFCQ